MMKAQAVLKSSQTDQFKVCSRPKCGQAFFVNSREARPCGFAFVEILRGSAVE